MAETNSALCSKDCSNDDTSHPPRLAPLRSLKWSGALLLLVAGLVAGLSSQVQADPRANHVVSNCTFSTSGDTTRLQDALNIPDLSSLNGGQLEASYIIIYVRQNPNDGQGITGGADAGGYTGPILCINSDTDEVVPTDEGTAIPGSIDILGAEESSHIQIQPHNSDVPNERQKRVCHTVASNTDCFTIQSAGD